MGSYRTQQPPRLIKFHSSNPISTTSMICQKIKLYDIVNGHFFHIAMWMQLEPKTPLNQSLKHKPSLRNYLTHIFNVEHDEPVHQKCLMAQIDAPNKMDSMGHLIQFPIKKIYTCLTKLNQVISIYVVENHMVFPIRQSNV